MKFCLIFISALTTIHAPAAEHRSLAIGRELYLDAEFRKAAAHFQVQCSASADAEACYWAGLSYERLADVAVPFGCKTAAKAHDYFSKAFALAPGRPVYRDGFFDFLLGAADCSRNGFREAAALLSTIPESDLDYGEMKQRLERAKRLNRSAEERLGRLFLTLPRATYRIAALPSDVLTKSNHGGGEPQASCDRSSASSSR